MVIADDNQELCETLKDALAKAGYRVDAVNDGLALVAYLKKNQDIDAVILDLIMPERSGMSVFETIRSVSPASRLIIYTGQTDYKNSVYDRKADAFIEKTEGVEKIIEALKELLL